MKEKGLFCKVFNCYEILQIFGNLITSGKFFFSPSLTNVFFFLFGSVGRCLKKDSEDEKEETT